MRASQVTGGGVLSQPNQDNGPAPSGISVECSFMSLQISHLGGRRIRADFGYSRGFRSDELATLAMQLRALPRISSSRKVEKTLAVRRHRRKIAGK
jgi:hypothetical protein